MDEPRTANENMRCMTCDGFIPKGGAIPLLQTDHTGYVECMKCQNKKRKTYRTTTSIPKGETCVCKCASLSYANECTPCKNGNHLFYYEDKENSVPKTKDVKRVCTNCNHETMYHVSNGCVKSIKDFAGEHSSTCSCGFDNDQVRSYSTVIETNETKDEKPSPTKHYCSECSLVIQDEQAITWSESKQKAWHKNCYDLCYNKETITDLPLVKEPEYLTLSDTELLDWMEKKEACIAVTRSVWIVEIGEVEVFRGSGNSLRIAVYDVMKAIINKNDSL